MTDGGGGGATLQRTKPFIAPCAPPRHCASQHAHTRHQIMRVAHRPHPALQPHQRDLGLAYLRGHLAGLDRCPAVENPTPPPPPLQRSQPNSPPTVAARRQWRAPLKGQTSRDPRQSWSPLALIAPSRSAEQLRRPKDDYHGSPPPRNDLTDQRAPAPTTRTAQRTRPSCSLGRHVYPSPAR